MEKNRKRERRRVPTNRGSDQSRDHVQETDLHHGAQPMQDWGRDDSTLSDTRGQNAQVSEDHAMRHEADTPELHGDLSVNQTMSPRMLYKVAREAQIAVNLAREETRILRRKYDDLLNETEDPEISSQQGPPKKQELMDIGSELQRKIKHTKQLGQKFLVTSMLWIHDPVNTFKTTRDNQYSPLGRFENIEQKIQGQISEIYANTPRELVGMIGQDWFVSAFRDGMQAQRSNGASRLRACGNTIFDCSVADLKTSEARRNKFLNKIGWRMNSKGHSAFSLWNVEVLHADYSGKFDVNKVFLNPLLKVVLSCVIRGPGSIVAMKKGMPYEGARSTETLDVKWGLQHTTPGMVACAAILARWVLSPDSILKERGAQSGINWHEDFDNYLEYLEIGLGKRKGSVLTIFREWDRILFPHTTSGLGGPLNDEDREEAMKEAMDALNQDIEELPPSDQEHDDDGGVIREGNDLGPGESEGEA
ncbi:hypothetical protein SERLADRAFT_433404 [Serpula lacrymans var. lacrymans S7.9]|uniref:Uncharacterized protein n=1 Tax=Serpula lacrymans var. lacrymans (strain S7.9) TaxID=578457 RepID=F8NGU3_SERL9|nr:uncharacterized protein SERLADRAFT_433404 [Serpula lacrymans var. lacrymans S7.9]EGO29425.1 hypothetical protein SERLADRAFT_433404 [Serpula lacrymans var. lacrymans S7.9]